jgi:hypothetical protein
MTYDFHTDEREERRNNLIEKIVKYVAAFLVSLLFFLLVDLVWFGGSAARAASDFIAPPTYDSVRNVQYSYNTTIKVDYKNNTTDTFNLITNDMPDRIWLELGDLSYWRHTGFGGSRRITIASGVNTYKVLREQPQDSLITYEYFEN